MITNELQHACCTLADEIVKLRALNERLRAIVERLPKTADGAPLVPGMTVWGRVQTGIGSDIVMQVEPEAFIGDGSEWGETFGHRRRAKDWYSTREAAKAGEGT